MGRPAPAPSTPQPPRPPCARDAPAESNRRGRLVVEGVAYPVSLEDLPTRVESFKTLDDTNLVKVADVGQVGAPGGRGRGVRESGASEKTPPGACAGARCGALDSAKLVKLVGVGSSRWVEGRSGRRGRRGTGAGRPSKGPGKERV
jgi:hypothetical protein